MILLPYRATRRYAVHDSYEHLEVASTMPIELILSGKVQGVACRHYCSRYGRLMGLRGSATNLANGTVRVVLDTEDDETARAYVRALLQNPRQMAFYGFIERIDVRGHDGPISGDYLF